VALQIFRPNSASGGRGKGRGKEKEGKGRKRMGREFGIHTFFRMLHHHFQIPSAVLACAM